MPRRCAIVGVFGGNFQPKAAYALGRALARADACILTGGSAAATGETKDEVPRGALAAETRTSLLGSLFFWRRGVGATRLIGIVPSGIEAWERPTPRQLLIKTGLSHMERDATNGLTPDVVIAMRGGTGTLCELAFAAVARKPIVFYESSKHLRDKLREHTQDGKLAMYLSAAVAAYPLFTREALDQALATVLAGAADAPGNADAVAEAAVHAAGELPSECSFPGIPCGDAESVRRFNEFVSELSRDVSVPP